jgi:cytochrome c556
MRRNVLFVMMIGSVALGCGKAAPGAAPACDTLEGKNAVQTEMRRLECALEQVVVAIGRDDLAAVPAAIEVVHAARQDTERALESGAWKPPKGDLSVFVSLDETFHRELEAMVEAASAGDHAARGAALGRALGQCQGCHSTFRVP